VGPVKHQTATTLMARLSRAGFKRKFVTSAILPDWWDEESARDASVLPEVELRIARFLGMPISQIRDPRVSLSVPARPGAQLRRVGGIDRGRIEPAIHAAIAIAGAAVRNLRESTPVRMPPADPLAWRSELRRGGRAVTLDDVTGDLWERGIPVVLIGLLPAPKFQGAACIVEGRPVVLVGHGIDEPARVAFLVTHEAGHLAAGDCTPDSPVIDEDEILDSSEMEQRADRYAQSVLMGGVAVPDLDGDDFRQLARRAAELEQTTGTEAGAALFSWATHTGEYATAVQAIKALYRGIGARRTLREHFERQVDLDAASETDRALLRCIDSEPQRLAAAG
jgi:hypothetical protein